MDVRLYSRISVGAALKTWPGLGPSFARAAGIAALAQSGFIDDYIGRRAVTTKSFRVWTSALRRCGTPLCEAVLIIGHGDTVGARAGLIEIAPLVLTAYQTALLDRWNAARVYYNLISLLRAADPQIAKKADAIVVAAAKNLRGDRYYNTPEPVLAAMLRSVANCPELTP